MLEQINSEGKWWLPDKQNIQFNGTLTFTHNEGGLLTLSAPVESFINANLLRDTENFLILGELLDGSKVALNVGFVLRSEEIHKTDYNFAKYVIRIKFIFFGIHFVNIEDIQFENILVKYSNIDKWVSNHEIFGSNKMILDRSKIMFEYNYGKQIEINVFNNCLVQILNLPAISIDAITNDKNVVEHAYIRIKSYKDKSLSRYICLKNTIQDFLNFVFTDNVITLSMEGVKVSTQSHNQEAKCVQILYRSTISEKMSKINVKQPYLFRYEEIKGEFTEIIKKWFDIKNKIGFAYDLFFGEMYNSELYLPNRFLMLCQAIEIYYRKVIEGTSQFKQEHEKLIDRVIPHIENLEIMDADKNKVKNWIKEKASPSFKEQIEELYEYYSEIVPHLSIKLGDKETFARKIRDYRNGLTHGNIATDEMNEDEDLFWNYKNLQLFLQLCILTQLGFSNDKIKNIYSIGKLQDRKSAK